MTNQNIIDTESNLKKASPFNTALKWALVAILLAVISTMVNLYMNDGKYNPRGGGWILMVVNLVLLILPMSLCLKEYRNNILDGYMSFGQGFKATWIFSLLLVTFTVLFMMVFYNLIIDYDTFLAEQMDLGIKMMKEQGLDDQTISKRMESTPQFVYAQWFSLVTIAIVGLIFDVLVGLVLAAIFKRNKPVYA